jgi:hypothetical protein
MRTPELIICGASVEFSPIKGSARIKLNVGSADAVHCMPGEAVQVADGLSVAWGYDDDGIRLFAWPNGDLGSAQALTKLVRRDDSRQEFVLARSIHFDVGRDDRRFDLSAPQWRAMNDDDFADPPSRTT